MTIPIKKTSFSAGLKRPSLEIEQKKPAPGEMCKIQEPAVTRWAPPSDILLPMRRCWSDDASGSSPGGSKACNQNEEPGSLFYPVSSFTYNTPRIVVRIFRLLSM
jgi:hypothetical protein